MQQETGLWRSVGNIAAFSAVNLILALFSFIASAVLEETTFHVCLCSVLILAFLCPEWRIWKVITPQAKERWRSLGVILAISIVHLLLLAFSVIAPVLMWDLNPHGTYEQVAALRACWSFTHIFAFPLGWALALQPPFYPLDVILPNSVLWGATLYYACGHLGRYFRSRRKSGIERLANPSSQDRATLRTFNAHA